jgi:hypothetical protein
MFLYQVEFPNPLPAFDVRFAADRIGVERIFFKIDQASDVVFLTKAEPTP